MTDRNEPTGRMDGAHSATTPDLSRAALEVLAESLEAVDHMSVEDCFLQSPLYWRAAVTLRALAARVIELEAENARLREKMFLTEEDAGS